MDPPRNSSSLEKSVSMARGRARALCCGGHRLCDASPAAARCRQLPASQGSGRHESPRQGQWPEGEKNEKKSLQLLNSWGMKKPLLTAAETQSFKHRDDLESLEF